MVPASDVSGIPDQSGQVCRHSTRSCCTFDDPAHPKCNTNGGAGAWVYASGMSIPVAIDDLAAATGEYGWAYLLTVRDDLRPHIVAVSPMWDDEQLVMTVGRGTARNASARSSISLCYPPMDDGGYSLIVDGEAMVEGETTVRFAPQGAVLHRPALDGVTGSATGCGNDCEPVGPPGG